MKQGQGINASAADVAALAREGTREPITFGRVVTIEESLLTFEIEGNDGRTYIVELGARNADGELNGECTCADFEARCLPNLRLLEKVYPYNGGDRSRTQCKHIALALRIMTNEVAWRLAALRKDIE